jgi:hypothetical protein
MNELFAWTPLVDAWMQAQRLQWDLFGAWQRSLLAVQAEMLDAWACRWGGGAPIDI